MDATIFKTKITHENIGQDAFFISGVNKGELRDIGYGVICNAEIKVIPNGRQRSHEQLSLYCVSCRFIADQTDNRHFNTRRKVDRQTKLACHLIEDELKYREKKTGEVLTHLVLGSVSYARLKHLDACGYFTEAFDYQCELYNLIKRRLNPDYRDIDKDEYIELLKEFIKCHYKQAMGL